jgi:hypothetical protein
VANFGRTDIVGATAYDIVGGRIQGSVTLYSPATNGTLNSISCYVISPDLGRTIQFGVYDAAGNLIGMTSSWLIPNAIDQWVTLNMQSPPAILAATSYRFGVWSSGNLDAAVYATDDGTGHDKYVTGVTVDNWTNPITWTNAPGDKRYSIYGTYSLAGWTNITKVGGIASTSMAKVNGIAVANIGKFNGVSV